MFPYMGSKPIPVSSLSTARDEAISNLGSRITKMIEQLWYLPWACEDGDGGVQRRECCGVGVTSPQPYFILIPAAT